MNIQLENDICKVEVSTHGAELLSMKDSISNNEYIWQADPKVWNRNAPFLFPIVGKLKDDFYYYNDTKYEMKQHGFLRDVEFQLIEQGKNSVKLKFTSNKETRGFFPFKYAVIITYQLLENHLSIHFSLKNQDSKTMYFSYGSHAGFSVPLTDSLSFEDYRIQINPRKERKRIILNNDKQVDLDNPIFEDGVVIPLGHELFRNDALIFETEGQTSITLESDKDQRKIVLSYENFPYVGIWSPYPNTGNLLCIEPWCGIADRVGTNQKLEEKNAIQILEEGKHFEREFVISIF